VYLAATVPGWTRWSVAEEMLRKMRAEEVEVDPQGARRIIGLPEEQALGPREHDAAAAGVISEHK
jgi:hypothetical protein